MPTNPLPPQVREGITLINRGAYFEAHEVLEDAWRAEPGPIRDLYQGLLQAAVVMYHIQQGNWRGAWKVAGRALGHLAPWPDVVQGIRVGDLRRDLEALRALLARALAGNPPPRWPPLRVKA